MHITTNTKSREQHFRYSTNAREAIDTLYRVQEMHPFFLYAFVIMPDHCHFLLQVPEPQCISAIMNVYKSGVTFNTGIPQIWQPRFYNRIVTNIGRTQKYIHMNPVRAGIVRAPEDYLWSSASGKWDVSEWEW